MTDIGITLSPKQWGALRERAARAALAMQHYVETIEAMIDETPIGASPTLARLRSVCQTGRNDRSYWRSISEGKV